MQDPNMYDLLNYDLLSEGGGSTKKRKGGERPEDEGEGEEEEEDTIAAGKGVQKGFTYVTTQLSRKQLKKLKKKGYAIQPQIHESIERKGAEKEEEQQQNGKAKKKQKMDSGGNGGNIIINSYPLIKVKKDAKIGVKDIQDLFLWAVSDTLNPLVPNPPWAMLQNKQLIRKVCMIVHGLSPADFAAAGREEVFAALHDSLRRVHIGPMAFDISLRVCGTLRQLLLAPRAKSKSKTTSSTASNKLTEAHLTMIKENTPLPYPFPSRLEQFLLSERERKENGYPVLLDGDVVIYKFTLNANAAAVSSSSSSSSSWQSNDDDDDDGDDGDSKRNGFFQLQSEVHVHAPWVRTVSASAAIAVTTPVIIALDCEMCLTASGYETTRVSLVDFSGVVIYDHFVKTEHPVLNYLTRWSGVTKEILDSASKTLAQVQEDIVALVPAHAVLLGHGLENDLKALKIYHENIIDTALLYPHPRGFPYKPSLKHLAFQVLKKTIQQQQQQHGSKGEGDGKEGHDSAEDAIACIELLKAKLLVGPGLGLPNVVGLFELLAGAGSRKRCSLIGPATVVREYARGTVNAHAVADFKACVERTASELNTMSATEVVVVSLETLATDLSAVSMLTQIVNGKEADVAPGTLFLIVSDPDSRSKQARDGREYAARQRKEGKIAANTMPSAPAASAEVAAMEDDDVEQALTVDDDDELGAAPLEEGEVTQNPVNGSNNNSSSSSIRRVKKSDHFRKQGDLWVGIYNG